MREVLRKVSPDGQVVNLMKGKDGKVYAVLANAGDPGASVVFPVYWGKGGMPRIGKGRVMNNAELDPSTLESVPVESLLKLQRTGRASLDEQESEALRARDTQEAVPPIGDDTMLEVSEAFPYVNEKGKQAVVPQGSIIRPLKGYVMSGDGNSLVPCMVYRGKEDATGKLQNIPQGVLQAKVQEGILAGRPVSAEDYAQVGADADADMDETTDESADAAGKSAPEGTGSVRAADSGEARPEDGERDVERPGNPDGEAEPEAPSGSGESSSGGPGVPEAEAFVSEHGGDRQLSIADAEATARHWEKRAKALRKKAEAGVVYGDARAKAERDRARAGLAEAERQLSAWKKLSEELKRAEAVQGGGASVPAAQEGQEAQAGRPSGGQGGLPGRSLTEGEAEGRIYAVSEAERVEMEDRIVDWLSEENLSKAAGKTREEIFGEFGNELKPIACIPDRFVGLVSKDISNPRIYCGKGYFIDHALRNHAKEGNRIPVEDVDVSKYLNIQAVLDNPDHVKETFIDGKRTIVFIKKIGRYFAELTQVEEDGKIVLHKSIFNQKKEPYARLKDIRHEESSSEGGTSSISHAANAAPAISLESRGDDEPAVPETKGSADSGEKQSLGGKIAAAEEETNSNPTEGQKQAGNYKKGHARIGQFDITVENPKGSVRRGVDANGNAWEQTMQNTYGYIRGTEGVDGDHIDVFLTNDIDGWNGRRVYIVDQYNEDGTFDEHKVMLGFNDEAEAQDAYLSNHEKGWSFKRKLVMSSANLPDFEKWIDSSHRKTKPFSEYKTVKGREMHVISGFEITPAQYTTKRGKELDMFLVKFVEPLSKEQQRAARELAKAEKGWYDRERGGFMMRSEESARKLADTVTGNKESASEAQPLSLADIRKLEEPVMRQVEVEGLMQAIREKDEAQPSEHAKDPEGNNNPKNSEHGKDNQNTRGNHRGTEPRPEELPASQPMGSGTPVQDPARGSQGQRVRTRNGGSQPGTRPQYDVNRNYTNDEIAEIASSATDIVDGKVVLRGEVPDGLKSIVRQYKSGGVSKQGRGILDEYYTDGKIVESVNLLIAPYFKEGKAVRVLEPSVGIGNFIGALRGIPASEVRAFEINETTARITKVLYPQVEVNLRSFETEFIDEEGNKKPLPQKYDLVIGNPPYGSHRGLYKGLGEESKIARYEDYFVKRSLDVLKEGGVLAMVLPSSWMDRHTRYGGYTVEAAYRLPSGAFEATQVGTDIVILRKDSSAPDSDHAPYFERHPERVLGEVKQRKGRYGRLEDYVEGDIDAAIEAIEREQAAGLTRRLGMDETVDNVDAVQSAIEETGSAEKAAPIVKAAQAATDAGKSTKPAPSKASGGKYKLKLNRGAEVVPASRQFTHPFSEEEVEAFADTDYDGTLHSPEEHRPYANYINGKYVHDFYYAEGDIYEKLEQLEKDRPHIIGTFGQTQYAKQKRLLESVLPKPKGLDEITLSPNTAFVKNLQIPVGEEKKSLKDLFIDFCRRLPYAAFGDSSAREVVGYVNNEQVYGQDKHRNQLVRERRKRTANDLFWKFLHEELPVPARKKVVRAFNREYNSTYRPDYSKVPIFSSINKDFKGKELKLTSVQLAGIGRMTVKGVGVLAHEVGFGKTLSGVLAMHEAMTRGFARKPLIVVPNDNILQQWLETINEALPNATVNTLGNLGANYDLSDFQVNDGEFTIITYEGLKAMSFHDDTYNRLADRFSYITEDLKKHQSERDVQKELEKHKELKGKMKRGTKKSYNFEDFGFDWLTFDEVHNANHIVSKVRLDKSVASDFRSQSQRTSDLGMKTWLAAQYIQEENDGRNVLLLSATPFTNKPLEYYSILSLVGNDMLRRKGFFNVDQFFETFMEADNDLEIAANGRPVQKTNIRRFRNNGLFQQLLSEFIDIKGEEDNPDLVRPERRNKEYKIAQNELTAEAMEAVQGLLGDNETVLQGIGHARAAAFSPYATPLLGLKPKGHKDFVENSPKIDAAIQLIGQNKKDRPEAGQIIYSEVGVEFFPMIRDYLVKESGFQPEEVRIITGATSNAERVDIQTAFNEGKVKVVIGSPAIKEGLNLQGNTTDMYILSLPWNFTQLRQIEGRGWRQGNKWENIRINYMLTNDSIDVFMLQRLQLKQGLYNEAMKNGAESLDVSDIDASELKTALITDPDVRAEIVTVQERSRLQQEKTRIEADLSFMMRKYDAYNKVVEELNSQKQLVNLYRQYAEKDSAGDSYWEDRAKKEENKLPLIQKKIEQEQQNLQEKGIDVADMERKTEQSQQSADAIQRKIDDLENFQRNLAERYRREAGAKSKEQGDMLSSYLKERGEENRSGFYKIRPEEGEARIGIRADLDRLKREFAKHAAILANTDRAGKAETTERMKGVRHRNLESDMPGLYPEGDAGTPNFHRVGEAVPEALTRKEKALRDAIVGRLRASGIEVVTDSDAGQRVLDEVNRRGERVRMQAALDGLRKASDFILAALNGQTGQRKTKVEIPRRANRLAEDAIGHPIRSHSIGVNELVHVKNLHGENGTANDANSIPLRNKDIALMPYIMSAPTRVVKGSTAANGTESVRYEKDLANGVVIVVEREGRFDVEDMENITMWAQKKPATNVTVAKKASHSTSETIVISEADAAKIRKDAEDAILADGKVREQRVYHGSDEVKFFRTPKGEAYGFTLGGKIYLDPNVATADTPIHEYAHLWASALREANPEEWSNVVGLLKDTPVWEEVKTLYPELETDEKIADEVLAMYSGRRGAERLLAKMRKLEEAGGRFAGHRLALEAMGRVREALRRFWHAVADFLHIRYTSAEEVADRVLSDLLEGVNPLSFIGKRSAGTLEEVNARFNEELGKLTEANADEVILDLGNPSDALLSAGIPDRGIALYGNKLVKKSKEHGYSLSDVKDLPMYMQNPIAVFRGSYDNGFAILTELDIDGNKTLVTLDVVKGEVQDLNLVTSLYGKAGEGIINWINKGKLLWTDKAKASNYLSSSAPIADATSNPRLSDAANIVETFENPKLPEAGSSGEVLFRRGFYGGNRGYVGYSMSRRAAEAREEGRFPKTDFKKEYHVSEHALKALVRTGFIDGSEWHHTSKYGNRTPFYGWTDE